VGCRRSRTIPAQSAGCQKDRPARPRKRRGDAYSPLYVEPLSDARTKLADFFNSLLELVDNEPVIQLGYRIWSGNGPALRMVKQAVLFVRRSSLVAEPASACSRDTLHASRVSRAPLAAFFNIR